MVRLFTGENTMNIDRSTWVVAAIFIALLAALIAMYWFGGEPPTTVQ
jgi:hypothetical protein